MSGHSLTFQTLAPVQPRSLTLNLGFPRVWLGFHVPAQVTWTVMGASVGALYGLALGHQALWISLGLAAAYVLGNVAKGVSGPPQA